MAKQDELIAYRAIADRHGFSLPEEYRQMHERGFFTLDRPAAAYEFWCHLPSMPRVSFGGRWGREHQSLLSERERKSIELQQIDFIEIDTEIPWLH